MNPAVLNERVFGPSTLPSSAVIRVFLAEDHHITLWGLRRLIESAAPRMVVVGSASTREELLLHDAAALADVIVLDLDLAGEDTAAAIDGLRPRCQGHVLVLTAADDSDRQRAAVMKGARDTATTAVRYRIGHAEAAQTLASQLPGGVPTQAGTDSADSLNLRIVLGHDLRSGSLCTQRS